MLCAFDEDIVWEGQLGEQAFSREILSILDVC